MQYARAVQANGEEAAKDSISRGWDYVRATGRYLLLSKPSQRLSLYPQVKFFLNRGLLQGLEDKLHSWEEVFDGKRRKAVDGLALLGRYQRHISWGAIGDGKVALRYSTGHQDPFRFNTVRLEAGVQVLQVPIVVGTQKGCMSDLTQYYHNVTGCGIEIEISGFSDHDACQRRWLRILLQNSGQNSILLRAAQIQAHGSRRTR